MDGIFTPSFACFVLASSGGTSSSVISETIATCTRWHSEPDFGDQGRHFLWEHILGKLPRSRRDRRRAEVEWQAGLLYPKMAFDWLGGER